MDTKNYLLTVEFESEPMDHEKQQLFFNAIVAAVRDIAEGGLNDDIFLTTVDLRRPSK